ncbi:MAG: GTP-binding protein [Alteromonadaceae bacterium]|nr:GTP-binding protein [Alteromonadaceae bacterium]|tara:strand:- start:23 stop:2662 length:2640 start_codon:yes stop_codon:yes gene_type:complete
MKVSRLAVKELRQFSRQFELTALEPGLNLISGANETGKSALVRALQAAFFERYSTKSVEDLRPWQDPNAAPEVQVDFEHDGLDYSLSKQFLKKPRCRLTLDRQVLEGDQAEQHLQQLLGFSYPGKGASREEYWGIPGLLWITQGTGQDLARPISHAHGFLRESLSQGMEDLATSGGDRLIDEIAAERSTLLTQTGKQTGELKKAVSEVESAAAVLAETDRRLSQSSSAIERLGVVRREWQEHESARPWEEAEQKQARAADQLHEVNRQRQQLVSNETDLNRTRRERQQLLDQLGQWRDEADQLESRARRVAELKTRQEAAQAEVTVLERQVIQSTSALREAQAVLARAEAQKRRRELEALLEEGQLALEHARSQVERAREVSEQRRQLAVRLTGATLDSNRIDALARAEEAARESVVRHEAIATRVRYRLNPGAAITVAGQALSGEGSVTLTESTRLRLGELGEITIEPGGEDLVASTERVQAAEQDFDRLLKASGVSSVAEARQRLAERQEAEQKITWLDQTLEDIAPNGLQALIAETERRQRRQQSARAELDELPEDRDLAISTSDAQDALELAREEASRVEAKRRATRDEDIAARTELDTAEREYQGLTQRIEDPDRRARQRASQDQLLQLSAGIEALEQSLGRQRAAIEAANPQVLQDDIQRYARSAENTRAAQRDRRTEIARLEGALGADGAAGLGEHRAEQAARLERLARRQQALELRAGALELLYQRLQRKRSRLVERLQAPLQRHVARYLRLLFPEAELTINEAFQPGKLHRNGLPDVDFAALSFGAREQVGVILRLAYADALKEAGRPTLIVLDDALVHSDRPRREAMQRVLYSAGHRHQILLFTCHPDNWADLGVPVRSLEQLKSEAGG